MAKIPFPFNNRNAPLPALFASGLATGFMVGALVNLITALVFHSLPLDRALIFFVLGAALFGIAYLLNRRPRQPRQR